MFNASNNKGMGGMIARRAIFLGCFFLLAASNAFALIRAQILSPTDGQEVEAGSIIPVTVYAWGAIAGIYQITVVLEGDIEQTITYGPSPPVNQTTEYFLCLVPDVPGGTHLTITAAVQGYVDEPAYVYIEVVVAGSEPPPPPPPPPVDETPDNVLLDKNDVILLVYQEEKEVRRYSLILGGYLDPMSLEDEPLYSTYSADWECMYVAYDPNVIHRLWLNPSWAGEEEPFVTTPEQTKGLAMAGQFLFVSDTVGAWYSYITYNPSTAAVVSQEEWRNESDEFIWSETNRRMYHFRDGTSPNDLLCEEIGTDGVLGAEHETPYHGDYSFRHPIRVAPDGSVVATAAGPIFDALALTWVLSLPGYTSSNTWSDAAWYQGDLYTIRGQTVGGDPVTTLEHWTALGMDDSDFPGEPIRLLSTNKRDSLILITLVDGRLVFTEIPPRTRASNWRLYD